VCQKDWFSSVHAIPILKVSDHAKKAGFRNWAWWVNTPAVAAWNCSDVVAGDRIVGFKRSWSSLRFQIENRRVNPFVSLHHGIDRKYCRTRLRQARRSISEIRPRTELLFSDVVNQKTGLPVL